MADTDIDVETDRFYFDNSDDGFNYENVSVDEDIFNVNIGEDLEEAVKSLKETDGDREALRESESTIKLGVLNKPEIIDDFVRNFLVRMKMTRTLDIFQSEWYELQQKGLLNMEYNSFVPDLYTKHLILEEDLALLRKELQKYKLAALKTKDAYIKLRKERDYHRTLHKRVLQEKNKLVTDMKRLKSHYSTFEPALLQLKQKYDAAMKEKMLTQLERDRAIGQINSLQLNLLTSGPVNSVPTKNSVEKVSDNINYVSKNHQTLKDVSKVQIDRKLHLNDSEFPPDRGINPILSESKKVLTRITKAGGYHLSSSFRAHDYPISNVAIHPRKSIIATTSDDRKWKLWSVTQEEIIISGEGHTDWLASCCFHPKGIALATSSGDGTLKIWNFDKPECKHTFTEHTGPVWSCDWHKGGDFIVSSAQDGTSRIWDLNSLRCRTVLRGHKDAVNSVIFLPFSNMVLTSSVDKTISLWDGRTGVCGQTFYGHVNSINYASVNAQGDTVVSCDSYGIIKLWDVRSVAPITSFDVGPHSANHVTFDTSGSVITIASNDSTVKMYYLSTGQVHTMVGHKDSVTCVQIDKTAEYIVSVSNDCQVNIWS